MDGDPTPQKPHEPRRSAGSAAQPPAATEAPQAQLKDTMIAITISFAMAFLFRGFVLEAFQIPTGSMAPTLLGAHMRFEDPESGSRWAVGPWQYGPGQTPLAVQAPLELVSERTTVRDATGRPFTPVDATDPMSLRTRQETDVPLLAGDRIFVLKGLYPVLPAGLGGPRRWDCVVFRYPEGPRENFIKRLIGLPDEQLALVDGDVFARPSTSVDDIAGWDATDWSVQRKPERVQREVWQPVYDSAFSPIGDASFRPPWRGETDGWDLATGGNAATTAYRYEGSGPTALVWDSRSRGITDALAYNDNPTSRSARRFPVSDVAVSLLIEPERTTDAAANGVEFVLTARGHELRISVRGVDATLAVRTAPAASSGPPGAWATLGSGTLGAPLTPGRVTEVEFWHVDQSLSLFVDGERVCEGSYGWSPADRIASALGQDFDGVLERDRMSANALISDPDAYQRPQLRLRFETGPFTLHRVRLDRDLFYQPARYPTRTLKGRHPRAGEPLAGTHPTMHPVVMGPDDFFLCGDNSPASSDARAWSQPDPWAQLAFDLRPGMVDRRLLIGKAFFVYFPAPFKLFDRPLVPDLGRVRWIW
ncbi:MAG: S26 family signal peptidase [Planctomycetota bacterium]